MNLDSINLCMLAPEFLPVWGGTGSYIVELIKSLPQNVNIHVITLKRDIPGLVKNNLNNDIHSIIDRSIQIHYLSKSSETFFYNLPFQAACFAKLPSLQKKYKFDILHSHLPHTPDIFLRLFNRFPVPTILTVHGTIQMLRDHALMARRAFGDLESGEESIVSFYPIIQLLDENYARRVAKIIAVSNITKELTIKHLKTKPEKVDVVYNGVDTRIFSPPQKEDLEKKYSKPTVLYLGRMISKKGVHILVKAMPEVLRVFPETTFLFAGGGNIPLYREIIRKMGIPEKNFRFVGHIGYFDRPKIVRESTVFVNPSFFENCSLSVLEGMSCGSAVIASDVGGNPEMIKTGKNGILFPAFDHMSLAKSIISLLDDENLNREIGKEARRSVERSFSSEKFGEETYKVYEKVLCSQ